MAHNTLIDPDKWVMRILQESVTDATWEFDAVQGGRFVNNVVSFEADTVSVTANIGPDTAPETFEIANTLWYAHDDPADSLREDLPVVETGAVIGLDPGLGADGSIDASSPAAGAGVDIGDALGDMAGNCWADPPSIGAYEVPP